MLFKRRMPENADRTCAVCGKREGTVRIEGGYACRYCIPLDGTYDLPTVDEVRSRHIRDAEILSRIDEFTETSSYGDLRFDDAHRLFFKGPWSSFCIPILSYSEISGYKILFDGMPTVFNSVDGRRSVFRAATDESIRAQAKQINEIALDLDSSRTNVVFVRYEIFGHRQRIADSRADCIRMCLDISAKLDSIVESNIRK